MTKTNTQKTPFYRQPWVIAILGFVVIIAVILCIILANKAPAEVDNPSQPDNNSPTQVTTDDDNSSRADDKVPEPEDKVTQFEGEDPNQLDEITGSITYKGVNDGMLIVSTMINQYLTKEGTCKLSLIDEKGNSSYSTTVPAIADVTSSVCQTFNIPVATLSSGTYQINIFISSDQKTGTITGEVEL